MTENKRTKEECEELRKEWMTGLVKIMAERNLGEVCYNCGSSEGTELHHIVPLKLGGTNNLSNIAVLCPACHKAAHYGRHINEYKDTSEKTEKKTEPIPKSNNSKQKRLTEGRAFLEYAQGKIGFKECRERIGKPKLRKLDKLRSFQEFCLVHGIERIQNDLDWRKDKGLRPVGQVIGYTYYTDGRVEELRWHEYY